MAGMAWGAGARQDQAWQAGQGKVWSGRARQGPAD